MSSWTVMFMLEKEPESKRRIYKARSSSAVLGVYFLCSKKIVLPKLIGNSLIIFPILSIFEDIKFLPTVKKIYILLEFKYCNHLASHSTLSWRDETCHVFKDL